MDPEEKRQELEKDILSAIEEQLKSGQMTEERAKEIAQFVLAGFPPHISLEQIYAAMPLLEMEFSELAQAVHPFEMEREKQMKEVVTSHIDTLVSSGKLDEAIAELKQATHR